MIMYSVHQKQETKLCSMLTASYIQISEKRDTQMRARNPKCVHVYPISQIQKMKWITEDNITVESKLRIIIREPKIVK